MLALLGVDPVAAYLASTLSTAAMLGLLQAILAPIAIILYDLPLRAPASTVTVAVIGSFALAAIGTLAAELGRDQRVGAAFVPVIATPLAVPLAISAVQVAEAGTYNRPSLPWLLLAAAMAVVALASGVLVARFTGGSP